MTFVFGAAFGILLLVAVVLGVLAWVSWAHEGFTADTFKITGQAAIPAVLAVGLAVVAL